MWAIGVITYFLLCGYTPFDRDSNLEEMQAILIADYSFTPLEYWRGVSLTAREFIRRCLTVEPSSRMTAHEALSHPWIADLGKTAAEGEEDLLPTVKKNFNARRTLHAAIDTVRAINKLREGQFMNGGRSREPVRRNAQAQQVDDGAVTAQGQLPPTTPPLPSGRKDDSGVSVSGASVGDSGYGTQEADAGGDVAMDDAPPVVPASLRPGSDANKVVETSKGLWSGGGSRR